MFRNTEKRWQKRLREEKRVLKVAVCVAGGAGRDKTQCLTCHSLPQTSPSWQSMSLFQRDISSLFKIAHLTHMEMDSEEGFIVVVSPSMARLLEQVMHRIGSKKRIFLFSILSPYLYFTLTSMHNILINLLVILNWKDF